MKALRCSIIIPAYNEGSNIISVLQRINESVKLAYECIVVVDSKTDPTIPHILKFSKSNSQFRYIINTNTQGPANAIKFGISQAKAPAIVITMADGSDDPKNIDELVLLVERGVAIAAASRYMPGGQQIGAPYLKGLLSKLAGRSLYQLRHVGTRDSTNSFKAYSRNFLESILVESSDGFEIALELVAKAKRKRLPVAEIPTIWLERSYGTSNFQLWRWIPRYLRWYIFAFYPRKKKYD